MKVDLASTQIGPESESMVRDVDTKSPIDDGSRESADGRDADRLLVPPPQRIVSLGVVRGLFLIVSVGVNSWPWWTMPPWFDHAQWIGIHPIDWVFPVFVTLSGCGLAFANSRRVRLRPVLQRVAILFALGLVYNWIEAGSPRFSWATLRIPGVLQLYAVVVLVIALAHFLVKDWKQWPSSRSCLP